LRGAPPGLRFRWDEATVRAGLNFTLTTTLGNLDLLGEVAGGGSYEQLMPHSQEVTTFQATCRVVSLETLIQFKRAAGRPKDLFRDKRRRPLIKWKDAAGAFAHWAKSSKGWLVDYSGLSYEKLTGGSGVQWPCNRKYPDGCERLYTNLKFPTAANVTQPFGHDLETGASRMPDEYMAHDPGGRAILKAANFIPPLEEPDDDYPFILTTGRVVYHFHTRTKTGRARELQTAAAEPFVEVHPDDAAKLGVTEGDAVEVVSRRGAVRVPARLTADILPGHLFIPFHYGYWNAPDSDHDRAANELTITGWDPVSKQPHYKYAAARLRKATGGLTAVGGKIADRPLKRLVARRNSQTRCFRPPTRRGSTSPTRSAGCGPRTANSRKPAAI
jgi:anaerobic selenocysteine-containing dehydrogenase